MSPHSSLNKKIQLEDRLCIQMLVPIQPFSLSKLDFHTSFIFLTLSELKSNCYVIILMEEKGNWTAYMVLKARVRIWSELMEREIHTQTSYLLKSRSILKAFKSWGMGRALRILTITDHHNLTSKSGEKFPIY